jgi:hypothetical protein
MKKPISIIFKEQKDGGWEENASTKKLFDRGIETPTVCTAISILLFLICIIASGKTFASAETD